MNRGAERLSKGRIAKPLRRWRRLHKLGRRGRAAIHDNRCVGVDNTATRNNPVIPIAGHGDRAVGSRESCLPLDSAKTCAVLSTRWSRYGSG